MAKRTSPISTAAVHTILLGYTIIALLADLPDPHQLLQDAKGDLPRAHGAADAWRPSP